MLQWCASWAGSVMNRSAVKSHGRTVYEYVTGHRMKCQLAMFGESVLWRAKRHSGNLNKHDPEWHDAVYLGISGVARCGLALENLSSGEPSGTMRTLLPAATRRLTARSGLCTSTT